jgi:hypothetical protein
LNTRRDLETHLGRAIPDDNWRRSGERWTLYAEDFGIADAAENVYEELVWDGTWDEAADDTNRSTFRSLSARHTREAAPSFVYRGLVMGRVTAALLMDTHIGKAIASWRKRYLPSGSVLSVEDARSWIETESSKVGQGPKRLTCHIRHWVLELKVPEESSLGELSLLANRLLPEGLDEFQAIEWIVTGRSPYLPPVVTGGWQGGTVNRVLIKVDLSATPEEVAESWASYRGFMPLKHTLPRRRPTSKSLELAAFHAETRRAGESWDVKRRRWNTLHPPWRYEHNSNFQRDATKALANLNPQIDASAGPLVSPRVLRRIQRGL